MKWPQVFRRRQARHDNPPTSFAAAALSSDTQNIAILDRLMTAGLHGYTADELDAHFAWPAASAGRRLSDLLSAGLVAPCGTTRCTRRGRPARVFAITIAGREYWRTHGRPAA